MKVLWLASWYPNTISPFDGDFIQRHARAVSLFMPVTVIHVSQLGENTDINEGSHVDRVNQGVREIIIFFKFRRTGLRLFDKLRYNYLYYQAYRKTVRELFREDGKPDIVHVHVPMKAGNIARWIKRKWKIPYIVSEQSSFYETSAPNNFFARNYLHRFATRKIFQQASAISNVSQKIGSVLEQEFKIDKVTVIHNTVNTELFFFKQNSPLKFRFLHVSTLGEQKNITGILRVSKRLAEKRNDFELVVVGPHHKIGPGMVETHQDIIFTGELSYQAVAEKMQEASGFLLFSRHENFPCVIVEALCCGLPCISSRAGGISEAIDETNGILVNSGNEEELLTAMETMLEEYGKYNRQLIASAARDKYNYQVIGQQFTDLYKRVKINPKLRVCLPG